MNKYIILIPFHHLWEWHTEYAGQTAILLSRKHTVICFLWAEAVSVRDIVWDKKSFHLLSHPKKNLFLYQPLHILPFRRFAVIRAMNFIINIWVLQYIKNRLKQTRGQRTILWLFGFFEPLFVLLLPLFRKTPIYYDCIDVAWQPVPWKSKLVEAAERTLVSKARWMSVHSHALLHRWKPLRSSVFLVPAGVTIIKHQQKTHRHITPRFAHKQPIVGYIGAIDYRIDFRLLRELIKRNPRWNFLLVGPVFVDTHAIYVQRGLNALQKMPNVRFTAVERKYIPNILSSFDIGIIPYTTSLKFNRYSYPLKLMEYFWMGLPVIATDIYELRKYPGLVARGETVTAWEKHIEHFLASPLTQKQKKQARVIAEKNSWESKLRTITGILETDMP